MDYAANLEKLLTGASTIETIRDLFSATMHGQLTPAQISAWLIALRAKGESPAEIAQMARVMREMATPISRTDLPPFYIDTCGTGGDQSHLMNISTLVGLTLAAMGIPVAKHGNRAVSSSSGSADILESLGYPLTEDPELVPQRLNDKKFVFLFAPHYHSSMKFAAPVRKELGVRTVFNILGPLANPLAAPIQLLGVFKSELLEPMAETLKLLGAQTALVVHSDDHLDEISPIAQTQYALLSKGSISTGVIQPPKTDRIHALLEIQVAGKQDAFEKFTRVVHGKFSAGAYTTAINAAAAKLLFESAAGGSSIQFEARLFAEADTIYKEIQSGILIEATRF